MQSGLAETAIAPATDEVRVADFFANVQDARRQARSLARLSEAARSGSLTALASWSLKNPLFALRILGKVSFSAFRRRDETESQAVEEKSISESMGEVIDMIDSSMDSMQETLRTMADRDRSFYSPAYLDSTPFVRLTLRQFDFFSLPLAGLNDGNQSFFEGESLMTLLIHRSGVALLTVAIPMPASLNTSEMFEVNNGARMRFKKTAILSREVLEFSSRPFKRTAEDVPGTWLPETTRGTTWKSLAIEGGLTVEDIFFNFYAYAIRHSLRSPSSPGYFFMCYHSLCVDALGCCANRKRWLSRHKAELAGLVGRFERYGNATSGTVANLLAKDWSLTESDSVYLNPGNMLRLHWNWIDHGREVSEDLWTLAVIDSFLLRFSQLEQLKKRFFDANLNVRSLNQAQLRIALGLHEFRSSEIGFGSASDMVKYLSDSQDLDRSYQHVLDRISSLSSLIEARRALRNVRRDTILTGLGSVAAVFFALPPIDQSIALLVSLPRSGINILGGYEGDAHALALRVYQTLLAVLLMGFLGSLFFRFAFKKIKKPRFRRPLKRFGITWRGLPHREGDKQG